MIKTCTLILCLFWTTFSYSQEKQVLLPVAQMHADLAILKSALTSLHPGIYRYLTKAKLDRYFDDILAETNRPLSLRDYYIKLSQLTEKLKCGHTYLNPYNQKKATIAQLFSAQVIPLLFKVIGNKVIVTHNLSEQAQIKPGDEIVSINGKATKEIIDSLLTVSRADGKHGLNKQLDNIGISPYLVSQDRFALFDIYFPLFFVAQPAADYFKVGVKPFRNKKGVVYELRRISKQMRQQRYQEQFAAEAMQPTATFKWLSAQCGYLKIRDFSTKGWGGNYEHYLDSIFIKLKAIKATQLIVDIRDNEGGDDYVRNKVISYLISRPAYHSIRRYFRFLKVSDSLMPHLKTWDPSFKSPKIASDYERTEAGLYYKKNTSTTDSILPDSNHFAGQVYLLTNATNSSSSFFMADILQENKYAKLAGEATGGTKQGINGGQFFFLYLPSSGIEVDIPLIYQAPLKYRKDEGVNPDLAIKTKQNDIANGTDAPLKYLMRHLPASGKPDQ